jgi:hypothetical protein
MSISIFLYIFMYKFTYRTASRSRMVRWRIFSSWYAGDEEVNFTPGFGVPTHARVLVSEMWETRSLFFICINTYIYIFIYIYVFMYLRIYVFMYLCIYVCMYICIYMLFNLL